MKRKKRSKEEGHMSALIRRRMIQRDHGDKSKYTRKEKGHMAALIRRKMIQRDHGDKSKYTRKEKHKKGWSSNPSFVYLQGK